MSITVRNLEIGGGIPKIAVPIIGKTESEILHQAEQIADSCADLAEWRADFYESLMDGDAVSKLLCKLRNVLGDKLLLFTVRTRNEGGEAELDPKDYRNILLNTVKGTDLIDVELSAGECIVREIAEKAHACGAAAVLSYHNFSETPEDKIITEKLCAMERLGGDILKIAVMPECAADVQRVMKLSAKIAEELKKPLVIISMGELGQETRYKGEAFGSCITFGTIGESSAPGQIGCSELKALLDKVHEELR